MFVRVRSRLTGHHFDIHEHQFDGARHVRLWRFPPTVRPRRTKFRVGILPALSVSPAGEEEVEDVSDYS